MKIAKLILHFNTPELTANLSKMVPGSIVVNNGSEDIFPGEIKFKDNLGFVKNWNRAIKSLINSYDAFWLMNSDIEISESSVQRILTIMESGMYTMITPSYNCWMHQCRNSGTGTVREVDCMEFTAPIIHRDVFEKIGFFDERFNLGSGVDFDFCLRAKQAGIKLYCDDGSNFLHLIHKSIINAGDLKEYSYRANIEMNRGMTQKHGASWRKIISNKLNINKKTQISMKKIVVYTTIFGGYDRLLPVPKQTHQADFICITDRPQELVNTDQDSEQWKIIQVNQPRKDLHPRMRAKWYKIFPWENEEIRAYDVIIFIDGSIQISAEFVAFCLESLKSDIAVFSHPERKCIYDEVKASENMIKYQDEQIHEQAEYYRKFHPSGSGLYAAGVIIRKPTERIKALMMSWWHEIIKFSWQDQLSLPVVCRVHRITPDIIPGNLYDNKYFKLIHHANKEDQKLLKNNSSPGHSDTNTTADGPATARASLMNSIIEFFNYKSYLEIGLRDGSTFDKINCQTKESIDPAITNGHIPTYQLASDKFFERETEQFPKYEMIFIDGDHKHAQVIKDLQNSLSIISDNGCIIMHDTNPPNERFTHPDRCDTAYMALIDAIFAVDGIEIYTIPMESDEANGITVIFKGKKNIKLKGKPEDYYPFPEFDLNRVIITNPVSVEEFSEILRKKTVKQSKKIRK